MSTGVMNILFSALCVVSIFCLMVVVILTTIRLLRGGYSDGDPFMDHANKLTKRKRIEPLRYDSGFTWMCPIAATPAEEKEVVSISEAVEAEIQSGVGELYIYDSSKNKLYYLTEKKND